MLWRPWWQRQGSAINKALASTELCVEHRWSTRGVFPGCVETTCIAKYVCCVVVQVTDIYEYGWGQSFHFSPKLPGTAAGAGEGA